jgi:hypothetical protein
MTPHEKLYASKWFQTRPPAVQELVRRYVGKKIYLPDSTLRYYFIGVLEDAKGIIISPINPSLDYDRARAAELHVCEDCERLAKLRIYD